MRNRKRMAGLAEVSLLPTILLSAGERPGVNCPYDNELNLRV